MAFYAKKSQSNFEPAPQGLHHAVCCDVVDLGVQETKFGKKEMLQIRWQLEERMEANGRYLVTRRYTSSTHEKAQLWKDIPSWLGKIFTNQDREAFDLEHLIGENCQLQVMHKKGNDGSTYAQVQTIVPSNNEEKLSVEDYIRVIDREANAA